MQFLDDLVGEPLTLGNLLRTIRETDEMTQEEMAALLEISPQHLSNVENGHKAVSVGRARVWAKALGYSERQFIRLALQRLVDDDDAPYVVSLSEPPSHAAK